MFDDAAGASERRPRRFGSSNLTPFASMRSTSNEIEEVVSSPGAGSPSVSVATGAPTVVSVRDMVGVGDDEAVDSIGGVGDTSVPAELHAVTQTANKTTADTWTALVRMDAERTTAFGRCACDCAGRCSRGRGGAGWQNATVADGHRSGEWITHSTLREVYSSWWLTLRIDDVEKPDGSHTAHEVVRGPDAAGMVVLHPDRGILMIWRHRFMPDTWGWEIPGGAIDDGESPDEAARREFYEETGWSVRGDTRLLSRHHPSVGLVNQTFSIFLGHEAEHVGEPPDANEAVRVEWRSPGDVVEDLRGGRITDGFSQLAVTLAIAEGEFAPLLRR